MMRYFFFSRFSRPLALWLFFAVSLAAQEPEWIWHSETAAAGEVRYFRKVFTVTGVVSDATLAASCDNRAEIFLNGKEVARSSEWQQPMKVNVRNGLRPGENVLAVLGRNDDGVAALVARLEITLQDGKKRVIVTDASWMSADKEIAGWRAAGLAAAGWSKPFTRGKLGVAPWGDVLSGQAGGAKVGPAAELKTLPGFQGALIYAAKPGEGSWISMTADGKGRLIISPQKKGGMLRMTLGPDGNVAKVESLQSPIGAAMGLLWAFDSLYVDGDGPDGYGLYRLRDRDGDDQFEERDFLLKLADGEHGSHGIVLGPDMRLYMVIGNHTKVPATVVQSPHKNFAEDLLLPRQWDANGHAVGILAPGGTVLRSADQGKTWELFCGGFRNAYDLDFNADGELFTFDSDMEWDIGAPWYRPTRINHCVSAAEFGWRSGTGKWPDYYPDSLPATVNVGPGSPTGVKFGTSAERWPRRYRDALYAMDWAYGRLFAIHLHPSMSSYTGEKEEFVTGKPLNLTDLEFVRGEMFCITGGRGTQSGLYRVRYVGPKEADARGENATAALARENRHKLEAFHGKQDPRALEAAWPHLDSTDRFLRHAARIAIEWQPVEQWQQRALAEKRPQAALEAMIALARCAKPDAKPHLCEALTTLTLEQMSEEQILAAIRVADLMFVRLGKPNEDEQRQMTDLWSRFFPAKSERLNRELCQLLIYLEAPHAVEKTMTLLRSAPTQEEQMHYIFVLRNAHTGWTPSMRRDYFAWFEKAKREYQGGASFQKFLVNIKRDAAGTLSADERVALSEFFDVSKEPLKPEPTRATRGFVKMWKMSDLQGLLLGGKGDPTRGKAIFSEAQCLACHRFGSEGGSSGPDLTGAGARFNRRDLLEAIVEPSKVVSDQYRNVTITTRGGKALIGRIVDETAQSIALLENPLTADRTQVAVRDISKREESPISAMPEGLLSLFQKEEILDLLTYIESGGKF